MSRHSGRARKRRGVRQIEEGVKPELGESPSSGLTPSTPEGSTDLPPPDGSKRRQFSEFLKAILEAIRKEGAFQEVEEL